MQTRTIALDGKTLTFDDDTLFLVQVGRGRGGYKTRYSFTGNIAMAVFYYRGVNVGNGYKKRLLMNGKTLVRQFS